MPVITSLRWEMTEEQYDALRAEVDWVGAPPVGGRAHFAWFIDGAVQVVDAWDSADALEEFVASRIMPGAARVGIITQPTDMAAHTAHEVFIPE